MTWRRQCVRQWEPRFQLVRIAFLASRGEDHDRGRVGFSFHCQFATLESGTIQVTGLA
jgi:hypothetical protein